MAKIRSIHPNACESVRLGQIADGAERLYWRLQTHCDDAGRCVDDPRVIWGVCCIQIDGWTPTTVDQHLAELHDVGLITRYTIDGRRYLEVDQFTTFQHPKRVTPSKLPGVPSQGADPSPVPSEDPAAVPSVATGVPSPAVEVPPSTSTACGEPDELSGGVPTSDDTKCTMFPPGGEHVDRVWPLEGSGEGGGDGVEIPPTPEVTHTGPRLTVVAGGVDQQQPTTTGRRSRVEQAIAILADAEMATAIANGATIRDPRKYLDGISARIRRESSAALHTLAHEHPTARPDRLADLHNGVQLRTTTPADQSDTLARAAKNRTCETCHGTTWDPTSEPVQPCPDCQPAPTPA
jgi:hypothetical protein